MIDQDEKHDRQPLAVPTTLFTSRTKIAFALVLIVGALAWFAYGAFQRATVDFMTIDEVAALGPTPEDRTVGVSGKLVKDSFIRSPDGLVANFKLKDENGGRQVLDVRYNGEIGQVFFNDFSEIIMRGAVGQDGVFTAAELTVRCPSKYVTEQEQAEIESQQGAEPMPPPYQPGYFDPKA